MNQIAIKMMGLNDIQAGEKKIHTDIKKMNSTDFFLLMPNSMKKIKKFNGIDYI